MREWTRRPPEIKYLLNPAFCAQIVYAAIIEYNKRSKRNMPLALIYLILPLSLHKETRERIKTKSRITLINWALSNQSVLLGFPQRTKGLIEITNEAIEFLMCSGLIHITDNGGFEKRTGAEDINQTSYISAEIKDCVDKAVYIAKWFANAGAIENIYTCLGVRP